MLPAVALLRNWNTPGPPLLAPPPAVTKFWMTPELLTMPAPKKLKLGEIPSPLAVAIVNALAPGLNTMPANRVPAESVMLVVFERPNVAVSDASFGSAAGVQFVGSFQFPLTGLRFHVALPAWRRATASERKSARLKQGRVEMMAARAVRRDPRWRPRDMRVCMGGDTALQFGEMRLIFLTVRGPVENLETTSARSPTSAAAHFSAGPKVTLVTRLESRETPTHRAAH